MRASLRRLGNSAGVIIPRPMLAELGLTAGNTVDVTLDDGRLVMVPVRQGRRTGWAEAARTVSEAGDDALVWPEFGNAGDAALEW
jgi:antitoxin MazE